MNLSEIEVEKLFEGDNAFLELKQADELLFDISYRLKSKMDEGLSLAEIDKYKAAYEAVQSARNLVNDLRGA